MKNIALILSFLLLLGSVSLFAANAENATIDPMTRENATPIPQELRAEQPNNGPVVLGETVIFMEDFEDGGEGWFTDGGYAEDGGTPEVELRESLWEVSSMKANSGTNSLFHPDEFQSSRDFVFSPAFTVPEAIDGDPVVSAKLSFMLNIDNPGYSSTITPYLADYFMVWAGLEETTFSTVDVEGDMKYYSGYPAANSFQYLTSPTIDLTGATAPVMLDFDYLMINEKHWDLGRVDLLVEGMDGYVKVAQLDSNGTFESMSVDISDYAGENLQVRFAFLPDYGSAVDGGGLWVDNIKVSDASSDLFMDDAEEGNAVMEPFGVTLARLFYDYDRVEDGGESWNMWNEDVLFNGTADLIDLGVQPGDQVWLALNFIADGENSQGEEESDGAFFDDFQVTAISGVPADAGVSNVFVGYPQTQGKTSPVAATVSNFGFEAQTVQLWSQVGEMSPMPVPPFLALEPFADSLRTFDVTMPEMDSTGVTAYTVLASDMVPENDALTAPVLTDPPGVATFNYSLPGFTFFSTANRISLYDPMMALDEETYNLESVDLFMYNAAGAEDVVNIKVATWEDDPLSPTEVLVDTNVAFSAAGGVVPVSLPVGAMDLMTPVAVWLNYDDSAGNVGLLLDEGSPFAGNDLVYDGEEDAWFISGLGHFIYANVTYPTFARLQVIHNAADPGAEMVDVYLNGDLLLDDFAFRTATPFIDAPANVELEIGVAPGTSESAEDVIATFPVTLAPNETYVAIANGVLDTTMFAANPDMKDIAFTLFAKGGAREAAMEAGNVEFFAFHGATDAPTVDVIARDVGTLVDNAAYGDMTDYLSVPPASYVLDVTPGEDNETVVASFEADLSGLAGGAATVVASGFLDPTMNQDGPAFGLFAALPTGGPLVEFPPYVPGPAAEPVVMANTPPAIDGELDAIWAHTPWVRDFVRPGELDSAVTSFNDAALSWRAMWDYDYLYLFITIVDDIFNADTQVGWHGDAVELWLDGDNSDSTEYDGINDLGYNFLYSNDPENPLIFNEGDEWRMGTTGHRQGAAYWPGGVNLELAIPMENLGIDMPAPGHMIGMDVDWNDRDGEGPDRDSKVKWFDTTDNSWQNPSLMGTIELVERKVYDFTDVWYTDTPPMIDGMPDDMSMYPLFNLNHYMTTPDSLSNWHNDLKLQYQVVWDSTYLYYQIHVNDDTFVRDSGSEAYKDDGVELWFDGDASLLTSYDGINDLKLSWLYAPDGALDSMGVGDSPITAEAIMHASSLTEDGAFLEIAIPLDSVDMMPQNGYTFAHEIDYNDDDTGGERDTKGKTFSTEDNTWQNPSLMSPAKLMGGPGEPVEEEVVGLMIDKTNVPPVIDGEWEPLWDTARNYQIANPVDWATVDDWWDSYANFRVLVDDDNMYMFVAVHDDSISTSAGEPYNNDNIEIYFDGDNSKNVTQGTDWPPAAFDENDEQLRFVYDQAPEAVYGNFDLTNAEYAYMETAAGWNLELSLPLADQPMEAVVDELIGFEISVGDNDGDGRESILTWWTSNDQAWHDPSTFGTGKFTERTVNEEALGRVLPIQFTEYPINVDAEADYAWTQVAEVFGNHRMNSADSMSTPHDVELTWRAAWDYNYLYMWLEVKDDVFLNENSSSTWQDDGFEFWFDGDGDQSKNWNGGDEYFLLTNYDPDNVLTMITQGKGPELDSLQLASIMQASKFTETGMILEVAFPLAAMGIEAGEGTLMALDVDWNDSDTPGLERDTKVKTFDPTDGVWGNSALMGLARLVGSKVESAVEDEIVQVVTDYELGNNYPNPFNPTTTIEYAVPVSGQVKLAIYDVLGREIATLVDQPMEAGRHKVSFEALDYASGVYFYRLQTAERTITKKMMLLK